MFIGLMRTTILYLLIIIGIRLMGKHQVGELEPSELVLSLIIADLAAVPMQDYAIPLLSGIIPILTILSLTMMISVLTTKSQLFRRLLCGEPSVLIQNGKLMQREMIRNRFTVDELLEELRIKGYTDPKQIRYAVLETSGQLSVLPFAAQKPPSAQDLKVEVEEIPTLPAILVSDGRILTRALADLGHDRHWLDKQLRHEGFDDASEVFLLLADKSGAVFSARRK